MTNYTATECATRSALDAAIVALDTTATFDVVEYRENATTKYVLITPDPQGQIGSS